ncbi:xanthine dehydrogenase accessory factor [Pseudomonas duriflava]|uniref:Xanthine dehydrogenase accessory factor n=1 Tax=Pseudomonas duriflava TaxID=459528 RepID=A0A562Q462_9PSED|nr:XdhC family protein [Pseudomonas duriflava]TWI50940.1 xanthine dehydrogenase accessory factor [Pseudomonas duriflava]
MDSVDSSVLRSALAWRQEGHRVVLFTVVQTWGSSPRPPGAMLALRGDGRVAGSVSGGCIEDDLIARMHEARIPEQGVELITYGVTREEAARFGLPCGGTLRLAQEPIDDPQWIAEMLERCDNHELVARQLDLHTGRVCLFPVQADEALHLDKQTLRVVYGPRWRLLLIGAGQLSQYVAEMAHMLDFDVLICDPRQEFNHGWETSKARFVPGMPDDAVLSIVPDERTAIVALTHDPRLDDMALLTALKSSAFYVGALGSLGNSRKRRERLALFDLSQENIDRLHGPIGLHIGSHTPAEIAISLLAEIVAVKNGVVLTQKKEAKAPVEQVA